MLTKYSRRRCSLTAIRIVKTYACDDCHKHMRKVTTLSLASAAMRNLAGCKEQEHFQCKRCQRSFSQKPSLHIHRRKHSQIKPYICTQCNKRFITRSGLALHNRDACHQVGASRKETEKSKTDDITVDEIEAYPASTCLKQLIKMAKSQQDSSVIKKEVSTPRNSVKYTKTKGTKSSESKAIYSLLKATSLLPKRDGSQEGVHIITQNQDVKLNTMEQSPSSSNVINYLVNIDVGGKSKPVLITSGDSKNITISESTGLPCDVKSDSTALTFECADCSESFDSFKLLCNHRKMHVRKRPIRAVCPWVHCGKKLTSMLRLESHLKRHNGETFYLCDRCGKHFTDCVFYHKHKGVCLQRFRTYECKVCGRVLSGYSALQKHARIHTGEKPSQCEICGARFNNNSHLTRHKRIHIRKGEMSPPDGDSTTTPKNTMQSMSDVHNEILLQDYTTFSTPVQVGNEEVVAYCMDAQSKLIASDQQAEVLSATANVSKQIQFN